MTTDAEDLRAVNYSLTAILGAILFYALSFLVKSVRLPLPDNVIADLHDLLRDIGFALAVGVYVAWTIERTSARRIEADVRRYIGEVSQSLVKTIFAKQLPDALFDVVKSTVFSQTLVRSAWTTKVDLHTIAGYLRNAPPGIQPYLQRFIAAVGKEIVRQYIFVKFDTQYEIENVDVADQTYSVSYQVLKPFRGAYDGLVSITALSVDGNPVIAEPYIGSHEDTHYLSFTHPLVLPPGRKYKIAIESFSVRQRQDSEPWVVSTPCDGMDITVTDHDTNSDVVVRLDAPVLGGGKPRGKEEHL
jgi:hypothetical protein